MAEIKHKTEKTPGGYHATVTVTLGRCQFQKEADDRDEKVAIQKALDLLNADPYYQQKLKA